MRKNIAMFVLLLFFSLSLRAAELRIAVASNFYSTLSLIKNQFENVYDDKLIIIKGSTGKLYAQIKHGAPYDIYMAADIKRPELLEQQELILKNSRYTYASGLLALWSKKYKEDVLAQLKKGTFNKLAIANPKIAPYGFAAMEVLAELKLENKVKRKMIYGENIAQTFQFIQSGSADLGFVALSYVKQTNHQYWQVPENLYTPLNQQMVILKRSKKKKLAIKFMEFIKRKNIKETIKRQGYTI